MRDVVDRSVPLNYLLSYAQRRFLSVAFGICIGFFVESDYFYFLRIGSFIGFYVGRKRISAA
jgi:hypothetical protein